MRECSNIPKDAIQIEYGRKGVWYAKETGGWQFCPYDDGAKDYEPGQNAREHGQQVDAEDGRKEVTPTESTKYPAIFIDGRGFPNGRYNSKTHYWNIPRLAELSKDLPIFDLPLAAVHIGEVVWSDVDNARSLAEHVLRVQNADSTIPILMTPDGFVCDGWHRIVKGLIEGKTTIPARRFDVMPHPDGANT